MVEKMPIEGDGVVRNLTYATWRDHTPKKGYSRELMPVLLEEKYYDNLDAQPGFRPNCKTFLDFFEYHLEQRPNDTYLGSRVKLNDTDFGGYEWLTYQQVANKSQAIARGMVRMNLVTETEGDGQKWKFVGIWCPNRADWLMTHIANMYFNHTTIGFFDSMGVSAVDFILKQTELSCIFSTPAYIDKIVSMKKDGLAETIKFMVSFDDVTPEQIEKCRAVGVKLYDFKTVIEAGEPVEPALTWKKCTENDCPLFSYTSGTTGDSKGVKLTHKNILASSYTIIRYCELTREEACISYLPYPHSFEQVLTFYGIVMGSKIGFYCGNPNKITEDCALLRPSLFPSVPRLFNRIHGKIKEKLDGLTGCAGWLAKKAVESKQFYARTTGASTHGCYDRLVFRKIAAMMGGNVRYMITGSAPIEPSVLELLKICFCCPFMEGYGLTETSGGSSVTWPNDPNTGHVGGPLPCIKWRLQDVEGMGYFSTDKPYPRGELQMKGASVTSGYYKRPDKTKEAFDEDGWFKTGDVAMVYPNGSVKIIDRSKNIFKLSQGEYIAPEKIENIFGLSGEISQCLVYGDSLRSSCVAIIIPEPSKTAAFAKENGMEVQAALSSPAYKEKINAELAGLAKQHKLSGLEKPKDIFITDEAFTVENNLLTPTFKVKRNIVHQHFKAQIDEMYKHLAF